ncbi:Uncharacterised protein [Klebsiella pneumoniae]|nr:Uncharacterised protein [Klebsiella pneumoniae]
MSDLPDDYFLDADDELVDFLEKQGEDCIREITQSNSLNKENGYKLLSILIVGIGSSFLLLTQKDHPDFFKCWRGYFYSVLDVMRRLFGFKGVIRSDAGINFNLS